MGVIDLWQVYSFIKRLVTPFSSWKAFELGIIDAEGNILIPRKKFTTLAQRDAFGVFDLLVLNIKRLLAKLPGGATRLASYAAALWLIREHDAFTHGGSLLTESVGELDLSPLRDYLTELFDGAYPIVWKSKIGAMVAEFETKNGVYSFTAGARSPTGTWAIVFTDQNGEFFATGAGDQYRILATVLECVKTLVEEKSPKYITFGALKAEKSPGAQDGRDRLYTVLAKKIGAQYGYSLTVTEDPVERHFKLVRKRKSSIREDVSVVSAGSGAVAGIGVGADGEPGILPKKRRRVLRRLSEITDDRRQSGVAKKRLARRHPKQPVFSTVISDEENQQ